MHEHWRDMKIDDSRNTLVKVILETNPNFKLKDSKPFDRKHNKRHGKVVEYSIISV